MKIEILEQTVQDSLSGDKKFPQIVGALISEGVESYHVDFARAENKYYDAQGRSITVPQPHAFPPAADEFDGESVKASIKKSQQGLINYPTFIQEVADAGCAYYIAFLAGKRVIYFGRKGVFHVEHFPK